jgi:hypothetical protein
MKNQLSEIDSISIATSINIFFKGDLMQFVLDENMKMSISIMPENLENLFLMKALIEDAADDLKILN